MKTFICDCTNPDFKELGVKDVNEFSDFIDNSDSIEESEFLENCDIEDSLKLNIKEYPNDFNFFSNGNIYFFTHSCIEHFFR